MLSLKQEAALQGPLSSEVLDQGDAVGAWTGPRLATILFATAETLKQACILIWRRQGYGQMRAAQDR